MLQPHRRRHGNAVTSFTIPIPIPIPTGAVAKSPNAKNHNTTRAPLMQISRRFRDRYANEQLPGAAWRHRRWITAKFSTMTCKFFQYANFFVGNMQICRSAAVSTARRVTFNWADNENPAANISSGFLPPRPAPHLHIIMQIFNFQISATYRQFEIKPIKLNDFNRIDFNRIDFNRIDFNSMTSGNSSPF